MSDRLDSPGPIPEEYSRRYQYLNHGTAETDRLDNQHPTTSRRPEAPAGRAGTAYLASRGFYPSLRLPSLSQPISHNAQGSFFSSLQGVLSNRRAYGMAGAAGKTQQGEIRPLQPSQARVETQNVQNNGNWVQGRSPSSFNIGQQSQPQQIYKFQPQAEDLSTNQAQQLSNPQQRLQPSEPGPSTSGSKKERPSVKHLTCWWWNEKGQCRYSVDECLYAHHQTGRVADAPRQVKPGEPPVAGRKLMKALREEACEKTQMGPERELGILEARNKALSEAYVALSSITSESLSALSTLRQSVTKLAAEVINVERDRASHHQHFARAVNGIYQVDARLVRALRAVEDQGLLAGGVEEQAKMQVVRVEGLLVEEGLGEVVKEGKRKAVVPQEM
ncbi:hypothetical protein AJ78_00847 [Emergomyces pasteurianus Ep9510]|uniref:C3H1-type domain-containing protein n=1 Tax=Emergomyces pasteurianus Ep9510 TaxID=1447872 RepID=A0A1J9QG31_9EURO|nr:hypothetical protein AJ78_00847 [Emergomyces pasteurianus Ep9510]